MSKRAIPISLPLEEVLFWNIIMITNIYSTVLSNR